MCSNMVNPLLDGADELVLSSALDRFRRAADDLWHAIGDCASTLQKVDVEDYPDPFEALRSLRTTVHHYYGALNDSREDVDEMIETFEHLEYHVDSSAMKYGLNRLPTELLSRIFLDATSDIKSTIVLSHVCKQFRAIVNRSPAIWQRFWLSSSWDRGQILAIAERSAFRSLKAHIRQAEFARFRDNESDPVATIFSLHSCLEKLSIFRAPARSEPASAEIPGIAYSRFMTSPEEMPLLRVLNADFLPHRSLARSLVKLSLDLRRVPLASLMDFLSSTNALQDLSFCIWFRAVEIEQEVPDHHPVRLPGLVKLSFRLSESMMKSASIVAQKIRSPSLRTLELDNVGTRFGESLRLRTTSGGPYQDILQSNPSFTNLDLSGFTSIDLCHIPSKVEVLMLDLRYVFVHDVDSFFKCSGTVSSHQIRLIRFHGEGHSARLGNCVYHLRDILLRCGLDAVHFEFQNCSGCIDGSFNLEEVHRALIDVDHGLY
ncbi:hypothetical protein ACEPAH_2570 [Sanghuangporus vaninii]